MSDAPEPASPYLLPLGPERRALMRQLGIRPCALDYTDDELSELGGKGSASRPTPTSMFRPEDQAI